MPSNPTYYDVAHLLNDEGLGALGSDLFGGEWGAGEDEQVLVLDAPGAPSDLPEVYERPGVQLLVRGAKSETDLAVYRRAKVLYDFLVRVPDCTAINGTQYAGFEPSSNLVGLGKDENERFIYTMNFYTYRNGAEGP